MEQSVTLFERSRSRPLFLFRIQWRTCTRANNVESERVDKEWTRSVEVGDGALWWLMLNDINKQDHQGPRRDEDVIEVDP